MDRTIGRLGQRAAEHDCRTFRPAKYLSPDRMAVPESVRSGEKVGDRAMLGGAYVGLDLPASFLDQDIWAIPAGGPVGAAGNGTPGGHRVRVPAYSPNAALTRVRWGHPLGITWEFFGTDRGEVYAVPSPDRAAARTISPAGMALGQVERDLAGLS